MQALHSCWKASVLAQALTLAFKRGTYQSQLVGKKDQMARENPQHTQITGTSGKGYIKGTPETNLIFRSKNNLRKHRYLVFAHHVKITGQSHPHSLKNAQL